MNPNRTGVLYPDRVGFLTIWAVVTLLSSTSYSSRFLPSSLWVDSSVWDSVVDCWALSPLLFLYRVRSVYNELVSVGEKSMCLICRVRTPRIWVLSRLQCCYLNYSIYRVTKEVNRKASNGCKNLLDHWGSKDDNRFHSVFSIYWQSWRYRATINACQ